MARSRQSRRSDEDDRDEDDRPRRRRSSGGGRQFLALIIVGVVLLVSIPLMGVTGFLLWRVMAPTGSPTNPAPGAPAVGLPGTSTARDRLLGKWQAPLPQFPGQDLLLEVRQGLLIVAGASNVPRAETSNYEVMREGPNSVHLLIHPGSAPGTTREWDIQFVGDNAIQVTSTGMDLPVHSFTRAR